MIGGWYCLVHIMVGVPTYNGCNARSRVIRHGRGMILYTIYYCTTYAIVLHTVLPGADAAAGIIDRWMIAPQLLNITVLVAIH